ncbi:MAG: hypothetical protein ACJA1B_001401 [Polaribacter sp.]|jgi:hypothetical protein
MVSNEYKAHDYRVEVTKEDKENQIKLKKKENVKLIIDLAVALILFPSLSGFIGWLIPLQYSILIALIIGVINVIWFIERRF